MRKITIALLSILIVIGIASCAAPYSDEEVVKFLVNAAVAVENGGTSGVIEPKLVPNDTKEIYNWEGTYEDEETGYTVTKVYTETTLTLVYTEIVFKDDTGKSHTAKMTVTEASATYEFDGKTYADIKKEDLQ